MKGKVIKIVTICLVVAVAGVSAFFGYNRFFVKKTAAATEKYYTANVTKMNITSSVSGTGSVYAGTTKNVSANNNGTLGSLTVKVGDSVKKGQQLFIADSDDVRSNVTSAKNNLTKANLSLSSDESAQMVDDNKIANDKIAVSEAKTQLTKAKEQLANMTVYAPISGIVTAVNNSNGDNVQSGSAVLTIQDTSSMKIKISVDELDIGKVKAGQKAAIKFDAISNKTYEGAVETVSPVGTTSNDVTNYDVVVAVNSPSGIKLGMNGNVTIVVESKENALVVPAEAVVESNGKTYVRVASSDGTNSQNNTTSQNNTSAQNNTTTQNSGQQGQNANGQTTRQSNTKSSSQLTSSSFKLVEVTTGLETQDYIEITEGLTEGQQVIVKLPSTSTTTTTNNRGGFGDMGGMTGGMQGPSNMGGDRPSGNSGTSQNQK